MFRRLSAPPAPRPPPHVTPAVAGRDERGAVDGQLPRRAEEIMPQPAEPPRQRAVIQDETRQLFAHAQPLLRAIEIRVQNPVNRL